MNISYLSVKNILDKPLSSLLSILLFGFGVAIIITVILISSFLKNEILKNAKGIDLVVGAKGSPLQIILSNIFHMDFPTGNISLKDANKLAENRLVHTVIPLSLGDSFRGYRIVGTTRAYTDLYDALIAKGTWLSAPMDAVAGAVVAEELNIKLGDELVSAHGLTEGGNGHENHPFKVTGVLKKKSNVIDRLILVDIKSIWKIHGHRAGDDPEQRSGHRQTVQLKKLGLAVTTEQLEEEEITSLLIKYRSPMAAIRLPQMIRTMSNLQAASPSYETARLFNIIGTGVDVVNILGVIIIVISAISIFIALFHSLKERKYEIAIMRSMGAGRRKIFFLVLSEGIILTICGCLLGFAVAHLGFFIIENNLEQMNSNSWFFVRSEYLVMAGSLAVGILASIIPGAIAYRANLSETLARG